MNSSPKGKAPGADVDLKTRELRLRALTNIFPSLSPIKIQDLLFKENWDIERSITSICNFYGIDEKFVRQEMAGQIEKGKEMADLDSTFTVNKVTSSTSTSTTTSAVNSQYTNTSDSSKSTSPYFKTSQSESTQTTNSDLPNPSHSVETVTECNAIRESVIKTTFSEANNSIDDSIVTEQEVNESVENRSPPRKKKKARKRGKRKRSTQAEKVIEDTKIEISESKKDIAPVAKQRKSESESKSESRKYWMCILDLGRRRSVVVLDRLKI